MEASDVVETPSLPVQCSNCESDRATLWCDACANQYCATCSSEIHHHRVFSTHRPMPIEKKASGILLCAQCSKRELEFSCETCTTVVCGDCLLANHKDHSIIFINDQTKSLVSESMSHVSNTESSLNRNLQTKLGQIEQIENISQKKLRDAFSALRKMLDDREQVLAEQISTIERKNRNLVERHQQQLTAREQKVWSQHKVFAKFCQKERSSQINEEFRRSFKKTTDDLLRLQPPVRIIYTIEGLDQVEAIGNTLKRIRVAEGLPSTAAGRNFELERSLADSENCDKLVLRAQQLNNQDMAVVAHRLRDNLMLTNLDLSNNQIEASGVHSLTTALVTNTCSSLRQTLTRLNLSQNCVDDQGAHYLADMLEENTTLSTVCLDNNQIGASGAQHLANALKVNKTLMVLKLSENAIGDEGAQYLADALKTNETLRTLYVADNYIQSKGAKHLACALEKNQTLTKLSLSRNSIADKGASYLANALRTETVLSALYIAGNGITERGAQYLIDALQDNATLATLDFDLNEIGDHRSRHLRQILLIISECKKHKELEDIRLLRKRARAKVAST